jgi:hypothetical protein
LSRPHAEIADLMSVSLAVLSVRYIVAIMDAKNEAARVAKTLKRWIMHEKGLSLRRVDERTGHAYGYTSQVLGPGPPKLHLEGLFEILDAIDMSPEEFWWDVYPGTTREVRVEREPERLLDRGQMDELVGLFREVARRAARDVWTEKGPPPDRRSRRERGRG